MDKYLKMADVFGGVVNVSDVYGFILYTGSISDDSTICEHAAAFDNESATYITHAINSHDELVAEVERLRLMISECYPYIKDKADWGNEYEVDLANRLFDAAKQNKAP